MKCQRIEKYTLQLSFKELRMLKELIRAAIILNNNHKDDNSVSLKDEEIILGREIYDL